MTASVVSIDRRQEDQTSFTTSSSPPRTRTPETHEVHSVVISNITDAVRSEIELSVNQLYSALEEDSRLLKALGIIERAKADLRTALDIDPSLEFVLFDQELMTARSLLLKAFRYRELGEGYAAIVNASIWALTNRGPQVFGRRQVNVVIEALERVANGPLLHFDTAMHVLDEMEEAGLEIEPPSIDLLTDEFDD